MLCTLQLFVVKTGSLASVLRKSLGTVLAEQCTKTEEPSVCEHIVSSTDACDRLWKDSMHFPQPLRHSACMTLLRGTGGHQRHRETKVGWGAPAPGTHTAERGEQPQGSAQPSAALGAVCVKASPSFWLLETVPSRPSFKPVFPVRNKSCFRNKNKIYHRRLWMKGNLNDSQILKISPNVPLLKSLEKCFNTEVLY